MMPENVWSEVHFYGRCTTCAEQGREVHVCDWISCPTGGWWSHRIHPEDNHDANIGWQPDQEMDDQGHLYTPGSCNPMSADFGFDEATATRIAEVLKTHQIELYRNGSGRGECDPFGGQCGWNGHASDHPHHQAEEVAKVLYGHGSDINAHVLADIDQLVTELGPDPHSGRDRVGTDLMASHYRKLVLRIRSMLDGKDYRR